MRVILILTDKEKLELYGILQEASTVPAGTELHRLTDLNRKLVEFVEDKVAEAYRIGRGVTVC